MSVVFTVKTFHLQKEPSFNQLGELKMSITKQGLEDLLNNNEKPLVEQDIADVYIIEGFSSQLHAQLGEDNIKAIYHTLENGYTELDIRKFVEQPPLLRLSLPVTEHLGSFRALERWVRVANQYENVLGATVSLLVVNRAVAEIDAPRRVTRAAFLTNVKVISIGNALVAGAAAPASYVICFNTELHSGSLVIDLAQEILDKQTEDVPEAGKIRLSEADRQEFKKKFNASYGSL